MQSVNTHWLASAFAGQAARLLELSAVAWLGRVVSWMLLSLAWVRFCRAAEIPKFFHPLGLLAWFLWNQYGNWAGEWFIGGFEAKTIAYPCVVFALSYVVQNQWNRAWVWIGAAVAWHPVVGGWACVTLLAEWLRSEDRWQRLIAQMPALSLAFLIGLVGIVPALGGLGGSDRDGMISASQVHTFFRLSHHLSPQTFASERNTAACLALTALAIATLTAFVQRSLGRYEKVVATLLTIGWVAVMVSAVGWVLDRATVYGLRQDIAAGILRFYFFRWSDVVVPMVVIISVGRWLEIFRTGEITSEVRGKISTYLGLSLILVLSTLGVWHWWQVQKMPVPPADLLILRSMDHDFSQMDIQIGAPQDAENSSSRSPGGNRWMGWSGARPLPQRYADWLAVCQWIQENTPEGSLWLTPKNQQTFKWYAGRAEVVNWKDVPQDNASIIEWYRRIERCKPHRDRSGRTRGWETDQLLELAQEYQFRWVLVDRTVQEPPLLLECKYPVLQENRSFAVFYIPDVKWEKKP